jgi:uncharacterized protein YdeI (YjbR/CyaY-like superfamily)
LAKPRFFDRPEDWRAWLEQNHAEAKELIVGFHKVSTKRGGLSYREALDEALAFGWIDAVRGSAEEHWTIRFTRRKPRSIWSQVNIRRIAELIAAGRVHPAGLKAFEARDPKLQKRYSFENRDAALSAADERAFRASRKAWDWFSKMPPSYRRPAIWWVVSAKQEATRARRLATLIADCAAGRKLKHLTPRKERS